MEGRKERKESRVRTFKSRQALRPPTQSSREELQAGPATKGAHTRGSHCLSSLHHQLPGWEQDVSSNSSRLRECAQLKGGLGPEDRC